MDVCQLKHLSKMNLCGDTLFQEWKTEKTDLYTPCRTLFMGIDLQRSGKQTCSDKTDLSASTGLYLNIQHFHLLIWSPEVRMIFSVSAEHIQLLM